MRKPVVTDVVNTNTTGLVFFTGVIVLAGSKIKNPDAPIARPAIGAFFLAIFLAMMPDRMARQFAVLILAVAVFNYGIPIANRAGLLDKRQYGGSPRMVTDRRVRP